MKSRQSPGRVPASRNASRQQHLIGTLQLAVFVVSSVLQQREDTRGSDTSARRSLALSL